MSGTEPYKNLGEEGGAKAFFKKHQADMLKGTKVLWPEVYSYEDPMHMRLSEGDGSFQAEFQNNPIDPSACISAHAKLTYWDDQYPNTESLIRSFPGTGKFFGACDPSMGGNRCENGGRRMDVLEFLEWVTACGVEPIHAVRALGTPKSR